jgi:hypothetical protein
LRLLLGSDAYNGAEKNDLARLEEARRWKTACRLISSFACIFGGIKWDCSKSLTIDCAKQLRTTPKGYLVGHIHNNGLDNRRSELRVMSRSAQYGSKKQAARKRGRVTWRS